MTGSVSVRDFYLEQVLPALIERLDSVFPEFGWKRDRLGWVATSGEFTRSRFGARPDRVVAHGEAPRGFLIHGGEATLWTAYLNDGVVPRGREFVRVVRELAERAGVDARELDRPQPRDRRGELLEDFFALCQQELVSERGAGARDYLVTARGIPAESIDDVGLGLVPTFTLARHEFQNLGYTHGEIERSGVLADSRWPGRLCGLWRDEHGRPGTIWARALAKTPAREKYLYLRGARRTGLPPYGLSNIPRRSEEPLEVVLVEGVLDVHQFQARGIENVVALGGTSVRPDTFAQLHAHGVEHVTLCLDNDPPGRTATTKATETAARSPEAPGLAVIDPAWLEPHTDPDAYIRRDGTHAWHQLVSNARCAVTWHALELLDNTTDRSDPTTRRAALARAGRWLGALPPRLALEQEDAIKQVAQATGYDPATVSRAFRARYWQRPHRRSQSKRETIGIAR